MRLILVFTLLVSISSLTMSSPQSGPATTSTEPFNVGTFEIGGVPEVGIVLRNSLVVDLDVANAALEMNPAYPKIPMPTTCPSISPQ